MLSHFHPRGCRRDARCDYQRHDRILQRLSPLAWSWFRRHAAPPFTLPSAARYRVQPGPATLTADTDIDGGRIQFALTGPTFGKFVHGHDDTDPRDPAAITSSAHCRSAPSNAIGRVRYGQSRWLTQIGNPRTQGVKLLVKHGPMSFQSKPRACDDLRSWHAEFREQHAKHDLKPPSTRDVT